MVAAQGGDPLEAADVAIEGIGLDLFGLVRARETTETSAESATTASPSATMRREHMAAGNHRHSAPLKARLIAADPNTHRDGRAVRRAQPRATTHPPRHALLPTALWRVLAA